MINVKLAAVAACLVASLGEIPAASAGQDPFFSFVFDTYDGRNAPHTDTQKITALKPVRSLTLSLTSSFVHHLPAESAVLLDLTGVTIVDQKNDDHELSISLIFPGAGLMGSYVATKVTFDDIFHNTEATSSGMFVDGTTFATSAQVGFVPEPAAGGMLLTAAAAFAMRSLRRRSA